MWRGRGEEKKINEKDCRGKERKGSDGKGKERKGCNGGKIN